MPLATCHLTLQTISNCLLRLFQYSLVFALIRLLATPFNCEFGISRQYLRVLEWLFHFGQQRIERVESDKRLRQRATTNSAISHHHHHEAPTKQPVAADGTQAPNINLWPPAPQRTQAQIQTTPTKPSGQPNQTQPIRPRRLSLILDAPELDESSGASNDYGQHQAGPLTPISELKKTSRRISTPYGPPVFLLDDFDDYHDDAYGQHQQRHLLLSDDCEHTQVHEFQLLDAAHLVIKGVAAIMDDQVTKRFTPEQLKGWNLLTRTNAKNYQFMSRSLGLYWLIGVLIRYLALLPLRIVFTLMGFLWLTCNMTLIGLLPSKWRLRPYKLVCLMSFRMLSCGITSRLRFHNRQYRAKMGDICVANHTSPLDVVLLACDNCYALVGQRHRGLLGLLESALSRAARHVWFDRGEMRDRQLVTQRLREHLTSKTPNLPVLIFPEGTCINNSAVMMFRKGSFETTDRVCPAAIKYDARFGDPFWDSSRQSYVQYLLSMMSSWAIKCDVWYLPPMERLPNEASAEFANRVKAEIARQGGLDDLAWDGQLKRSSIKPTWLHQQQEDYAKRLKLE